MQHTKARKSKPQADMLIITPRVLHVRKSLRCWFESYVYVEPDHRSIVSEDPPEVEHIVSHAEAGQHTPKPPTHATGFLVRQTDTMHLEDKTPVSQKHTWKQTDQGYESTYIEEDDNRDSGL